MKIVIASEVFLPKIDGITNRLANTIRELENDGHDVLVIAPKGSVAKFCNARVIRVGGIPFLPYPDLMISWPSPRILWELRRFKPDVVHVVGPACLGVWVTLCAIVMRLPIVASYHTDFPNYVGHYRLGWAKNALWWLLRLIHNQANLNLVPSQHTRQELLSHGIHNVGIWSGGVDTELFCPSRRSSARRLLLTGGKELPKDRFLAIYVGRVSHEKNLASLLDLLRGNSRIHLAIVGDGPARKELEHLFADQSVTFCGFLRGEALAEAYASADFFVMPSLTETLGFVTIEAMSSGLPVLAARAGGTKDLVNHGRNGLLYQPLGRGLVSLSNKLTDGPEYLEQLRTEVVASAKRFCWTEQTRGLVEVYQAAVLAKCHSSVAVPLVRLPSQILHTVHVAARKVQP